jgi:hypothetical protein
VLEVGAFNVASVDALATDPSLFRRIDVRYLTVEPNEGIEVPDEDDDDHDDDDDDDNDNDNDEGPDPPVISAYMAACDALEARLAEVLPNARRTFGDPLPRPEIEPAVTQKIGDTFAQLAARLKARLPKP